ncbi:MAG TPA: response regulator, partial [Kofleriaceae bacterium]|nr:response regulator [Kofleriaceae bacterium]
MNVKKRILFVDDEPAILAGLQNLLYKDRKRWDMVFALGGQLALDEIRKESFDIVVSDMRMPGVDGATLLNTVKDECPATVRIMLSGHADREAIVRALPALHQLLSKPCDAATLRGAIERSLDGANVDR